jgi:hypothetical protein
MYRKVVAPTEVANWSRWKKKKKGYCTRLSFYSGVVGGVNLPGFTAFRPTIIDC